METQFNGKAMVLGHNIDTDQIYPGKYLEYTDPQEIAKHCFAGLDEAIAENFTPAHLLVAGKNFGCGSSREHAPIAILNMGAPIILAESFARIFYRNAVNLGLIPLICPNITSLVQAGDELEVDLDQAKVWNRTQDIDIPCQAITGQTLKIIQAGGIKNLMRQRFAQE